MQEFAKGIVLKKGDLKMKNERKCIICGNVHNIEEMYQVGDKYYCCDCASLCHHCGKIELLDNMFLIRYEDGNHYVCAECSESDAFFLCDHCEEYYHEDMLWGDYRGNGICHNCSTHYGICPECEIVALNSQLEYYEPTQEHLCTECIANREESALDNLLESYSYKPYPVFFGESSEKCFLGVELEVDVKSLKDCNPQKVYQAAETLRENYGDRLYLKRDGSLSNLGFEITTHPASLSHHMNDFEWDYIMDICKEGTLRGNDCSTAGLHIHLSRDYFGETQEVQDLHIAKLMLLISKFYTSHILKFSRRKPEELRWCGNPEMGLDFLDDEKTIVDKLKQCKAKGRYLALNLENEHTIEYRVFKSSLNLCTFLASLQFVVEISKYAKETDLADIQTTKWRDIFMSTEYPELKSYLERKELI